MSYHIPTKAMDCPVLPDRPGAVGEDTPGASVLVQRLGQGNVLLLQSHIYNFAQLCISHFQTGEMCCREKIPVHTSTKPHYSAGVWLTLDKNNRLLTLNSLVLLKNQVNVTFSGSASTRHSTATCWPSPTPRIFSPARPHEGGSSSHKTIQH